ncbi:MAG: fibronectin type III domain-containing protein [Steroidobacteraceae bacterium]
MALGGLLAACGGGGDSATGSSGTSSGGSGGSASGGTSGGTGSGGTVTGGSNTGGGSGGSSGSPTGSASLSWLPPGENIDGSTLTDLAGYHIYRGTSVNAMSLVATVNNPGITTYVVDNLPSGTYYFAVSAYNRNNMESDRSAAAAKTVP